jgi:hypothetical protein
VEEGKLSVGTGFFSDDGRRLTNHGPVTFILTASAPGTFGLGSVGNDDRLASQSRDMVEEEQRERGVAIDRQTLQRHAEAIGCWGLASQPRTRFPPSAADGEVVATTMPCSSIPGPIDVPTVCADRFISAETENQNGRDGASTGGTSSAQAATRRRLSFQDLARGETEPSNIFGSLCPVHPQRGVDTGIPCEPSFVLSSLVL